MDRFDDLKAKYASVLQMVQQQGVRLANLHVQDNKLFIRGAAPSDAIKNKIWDQIKAVDPTYSDLMADITVDSSLPQPAAAAGSAAGGGMQSYTVQAGDSLSKIAKQFYGDANQYMRIFEANKDKLNDPNKIQVGQELKIPS
jgi:nucleoid-associated protein YgaU